MKHLFENLKKGQYKKIYIQNKAEVDALFPSIESYTEKIWLICNDKSEQPICVICNNFAKFRGFSLGYYQTCGNRDCVKQNLKNSANRPSTQEKRQQTNLERYGHISNLHGSGREKVIKTFLEKYGTENPAQSETVKNKIKATNLERYGVECVLQSSEIIEKIQQTNLERYGVENYAQTTECWDKIKATSLINYGVESPNQSPIVKETKKQAVFEKYGVENAAQSETVKDKIKTTNLERYGVEWQFQRDEVQEISQKKGGRCKVKKYNDKLNYQGTYEKHFLDYCTELGILEKITKYPSGKENHIFYIGEDNKKHKYFPDFYIPELNAIIEIKSNHTYSGDRHILFESLAKHQAALDKGFKHIFIIDKNYSDFDLLGLSST